MRKERKRGGLKMAKKKTNTVRKKMIVECLLILIIALVMFAIVLFRFGPPNTLTNTTSGEVANPIITVGTSATGSGAITSSLINEPSLLDPNPLIVRECEINSTGAMAMVFIENKGGNPVKLAGIIVKIGEEGREGAGKCAGDMSPTNYKLVSGESKRYLLHNLTCDSGVSLDYINSVAIKYSYIVGTKTMQQSETIIMLNNSCK